MSWHWLIGVGVLVAVIVYTLQYTNVLRYAKSIILIAQTTPYEQTGTGVGKILVLGDSTGYGTGVTNAAESIAGRLGADFPQYTIINKSVNGDTIAAATERAKKLEGKYDLILLQLGANDVIQKNTVKAIVSDTEALRNILSRHTQQIVMMSSGNIGGAPAFTGTTAQEYLDFSRIFHATLEVYANAHTDFYYVHFFTEPDVDPFILKSDKYMAFDGLHPTGAGYGVWYETLYPVVEPLLQIND